MEKHFLDEFVREHGWVRETGAAAPSPWYNPEGDCILYLAEDCATVGNRIDDILTILRAADDGRAIGFQIKGIKALCDSLGYEPPQAQAPAAGGHIEQLTLSLLLLKAYESGPSTIARRTAYASTLSGQSALPASA